MHVSKIDKTILKIAHSALHKAIEMISYSIQLTDAAQRGAIGPDSLEKRLIVPEPHSNSAFYIDLDWTKNSNGFKQTTQDAQVYTASYAIICCKETYHKDLRVSENQNQDLYAAQMILKLVRDAMGHVQARTNDYVAPYWKIDNLKNRRIFEIKEI